MDAIDRVNDLIFIAGRLDELLERENAALERHDADSVGDLLDEKRKLVRAYEIRLRGFEEDPASLKEVDETTRDELADLGTRLTEQMEQNARMLEVAVETSRAVVDSIVEGAKAQQSGATTYTSGATAAAERTRPGARGAALTVDQTL